CIEERLPLITIDKRLPLVLPDRLCSLAELGNPALHQGVELFELFALLWGCQELHVTSLSVACGIIGTESAICQIRAGPMRHDNDAVRQRNNQNSLFAGTFR